MDLFFLSTLALALILGFIFFIGIHIITPKTSHRHLPPGKLGWPPMIGEALEFRNTSKFINDRMTKYSPDHVFKTSLLGQKVAVFCGAEGNKFMFSNENNHSKLWLPTHLKKLLFPSSTYNYSSQASSTWDHPKTTRGFVLEFCKPEYLKAYVAIIDSIATQHLEREWASTTTTTTTSTSTSTSTNPEEGHVKVYPLSRNFTIELACRMFMSVEDRKTVKKISDHFVVVLAGFFCMPIDFPGTTFNRATKAAKNLYSELQTIFIKRKRIHLTDHQQKDTEITVQDLLSHILFHDTNKLTPHLDITHTLLGALFASHDTTSTVITFVVYHLADHPLVYDEVLKEQMEIKKSKGQGELLNWQDIQKMKYSKNVINEVMRLTPPSMGGFREASSDFNYAGYTIPKGWKIHWNVSSTHQDPKYFPNPEKFDPRRFEGKGPLPFTFVPFGGGSRICPGSEFARVVILVFLHNLVTRFKWKKLFPNEKVIHNPLPIPEKGLPIRIYPHNHIHTP